MEKPQSPLGVTVAVPICVPFCRIETMKLAVAAVFGETPPEPRKWAGKLTAFSIYSPPSH